MSSIFPPPLKTSKGIQERQESPGPWMILPVCINDTLGPMPTHLLKKLVQLRGCMKVKQLKRESVKPSESGNFL